MNNISFLQIQSSKNSNWISNLWNDEKQELLSKALLNWLFLVICHLITTQMSDAKGNSFTFDIWFGCPTFRPTARIEGYRATSLLFTMWTILTKAVEIIASTYSSRSSIVYWSRRLLNIYSSRRFVLYWSRWLFDIYSSRHFLGYSLLISMICKIVEMSRYWAIRNQISVVCALEVYI